MKVSFGTRMYRVLAAFVGALLVVSMFGGLATAQDTPIQSTQLGDVPTSGGARPGPGTQIAPSAPAATGAVPVAISIPNAQVDAAVEEREIVDGVMQDPTGPWVVSWYKETPMLGAPGNTVMAGHVDYWDVGPSVFYNVGDLKEGDLITITGDNGKIYTYKVSWVKLYNADDAPIQEIVGPTDKRALTLITCGGEFDYTNGVYLQRTVVRANYVGSSTPQQ
jgi:LPXTG-site transpeptidase (sortase) family protein